MPLTCIAGDTLSIPSTTIRHSGRVPAFAGITRESMHPNALPPAEDLTLYRWLVRSQIDVRHLAQRRCGVPRRKRVSKWVAAPAISAGAMAEGALAALGAGRMTSAPTRLRDSTGRGLAC